MTETGTCITTCCRLIRNRCAVPTRMPLCIIWHAFWRRATCPLPAGGFGLCMRRRRAGLSADHPNRQSGRGRRADGRAPGSTYSAGGCRYFGVPGAEEQFGGKSNRRCCSGCKRRAHRSNPPAFTEQTLRRCGSSPQRPVLSISARFPAPLIDQQYLPDLLKGTHYYTPGENKNEQAFGPIGA